MANDDGHQGAVSIANVGIQSLILINGGGALALLAFYGDALSGSAPLTIDRGCLKAALITFALGVFAAATAAILAYLSQLYWMQTRGAPGGVDVPFRVAAVVCAIASAVLFLIATILAACAIQ